MKVKIERQFKKQINRNPTWLGNFKKRFRVGKNKTHFLTTNSLSFIEINKILSHSKLITLEELSQQQYNGLLYTNIAKLR